MNHPFLSPLLRSSLFVAGFAVLLFPSVAPAQNPAWGDISGRIVWGGQNIPAPVPINAPAGAGCRVPLVREEFVINAKNKGLKNVVVWLEPAKKGDPALPIAPALQAIPKNNVEIDQPACAFEPHTVALREGQTFLAKNSSAIAHNFKYEGNPAINPGQNFLMPPKSDKAIFGLKAQRLPILVECNIHPWMRANVFVFNHPYFAVTDDDGDFSINDAPAGNFRIVYWHDSGYLGGAAGRTGNAIAVQAGANANRLGNVNFPPPN